jgi:hypothetical protein
MLDTKEILAQLNQPPPPIQISQLERGPVLDWSIPEIARAYHVTEASVRHLFSDGRFLNAPIEVWLSCHGFEVKPDRKSGWLLVSQNNGGTYRLRVCKDSVNLRPPISSGAGRYGTPSQMKKEMAKIDGWALVFIVDLPQAQVWFISKKMSYALQEHKLLDDHFTCRKGKSNALRAWLIQADQEGTYAGC